MSRKATALVLTAPEVLDVVRTLEPARGATLTVGKLRYLDQHLSARADDVTNQARLYTVQDVALVRLFLRLAAKVPVWQARAVVALRNAELRRGMERGDSIALVVDWPDAFVVPLSEALRYDVRVTLRSVLSGVEDAIRRRRMAEPTVWAGWVSMPANEAVRELRAARPALAYA